MQDKPVALVTRANRGIGFQIAKDLAAHGFTVLVGSRNLEHGGKAAASIEGDARVLQLDVTAIMNAGRPEDRLEERLNAGRLSAREPVRLAFLDASGPTDTSSNEDGPIPW